jgi:hypothetical protein
MNFPQLRCAFWLPRLSDMSHSRLTLSTGWVITLCGSEFIGRLGGFSQRKLCGGYPSIEINACVDEGNADPVTVFPREPAQRSSDLKIRPDRWAAADDLGK